ncbi:MAG TPA: hypothetical protein VFC64_02750 [Atopostipes sp.]|nr:hypothetical protein [Atopostipes sp.]
MDKRNILLMDILGIAMKIQDNTEYGVFLDYSGHVDEITVRVAESKKKYLKILKRFGTYADGDLEHLEEMRDDIELFYAEALDK